MALLLDAAAHAEGYRQAEPFPHIVLDGLFPEPFLKEILDYFPDAEDPHWRNIESKVQVKYTTRTDATLHPRLRELLFWLNSSTLIDWLERLTGIAGLIPDPHFDGAGPHMIAPGGHLGLHIDYNRNRRLGLDRRINLLLYLNRDWKEEYGGHLELWSHKPGPAGPRPDRLLRKILPAFGRLVVFSTNDFSFHGHPDPLACPPGMYRKSIAMYYFSAGRPAGETWIPKQAGQNTLFYPRPGSGDADTQKAVRTYLRLAPGWLQGLVRRILSPRSGCFPPQHPGREA